MATSTGDKLSLLTRARLGKFDGVDRLPLEEFCELAVGGGADPARAKECEDVVRELIGSDLEVQEVQDVRLPIFVMHTIRVPNLYGTSGDRLTRERADRSARDRGDVVEPKPRFAPVAVTPRTKKTYFITRAQAFSIKGRLEACTFWGEGVQCWCRDLAPIEIDADEVVGLSQGSTVEPAYMGLEEVIVRLKPHCPTIRSKLKNASNKGSEWLAAARPPDNGKGWDLDKLCVMLATRGLITPDALAQIRASQTQQITSLLGAVSPWSKAR